MARASGEKIYTDEERLLANDCEALLNYTNEAQKVLVDFELLNSDPALVLLHSLRSSNDQRKEQRAFYEMHKPSADALRGTTEKSLAILRQGKTDQGVLLPAEEKQIANSIPEVARYVLLTQSPSAAKSLISGLATSIMASTSLLRDMLKTAPKISETALEQKRHVHQHLAMLRQIKNPDFSLDTANIDHLISQNPDWENNERIITLLLNTTESLIKRIIDDREKMWGKMLLVRKLFDHHAADTGPRKNFAQMEMSQIALALPRELIPSDYKPERPNRSFNSIWNDGMKTWNDSASQGRVAKYLQDAERLLIDETENAQEAQQVPEITSAPTFSRTPTHQPRSIPLVQVSGSIRDLKTPHWNNQSSDKDVPAATAVSISNSQLEDLLNGTL